VAQRPGRRLQRRGVLPARRARRPLLVADPAAGRRRRAVRDPPRVRLQRIFEHAEDGIVSELRTFVAIDAPIKFIVVKLRNPPAARAGCR
jgi:hypothetical protein